MKTIIRNYFVPIVFAFSTPICNAQTEALSALNETTDYDAQIHEVYPVEWCVNNSEAVALLKECLESRIEIQEVELTSLDKFPLLSSYPLMNKYNSSIVGVDFGSFQPSTFKPLRYNLPFFTDRIIAIRIDGTNYVLVINPVK